MAFYINEKLIRGAIASIISSIIAYILNIILIYFIPLHEIIIFISYFIISNILSYSLDILIAKKHFNKQIIAYSNIKQRIVYLINSFLSVSFIKFMITVLIDSILKYSIFNKTVSILDEYNIIIPYRDPVLLTIISIFTFVMFINNLRFNWAYNNNSDYKIDLIVLSWLALSIIIFFK